MTEAPYTPVYSAVFATKLIFEQWNADCRALNPSDDAGLTLLFYRIAVELENAHLAGGQGIPLEGRPLIDALETLTNDIRQGGGAFDIEAAHAAEAEPPPAPDDTPILPLDAFPTVEVKQPEV